MAAINQVLQNRYQIIQQIGAGGFGHTYLTKDLSLPGQPFCVVKQINPSVPSSETWQIVTRLFNTEAEILYKLGREHDQIPELYAYFEELDVLYLVQEFIEGSGLDSELSQGIKYREQEVILLLRDILEILAFVHGNGVIHRDIKPSNLIRRRKDGKLVLIDFGAVKEIKTLSTQYHGQSGLTIIIGSSGYMPSEQANGRPKLSSDVYAVGMIGIQALTGIRPHEISVEPETGEIKWREENLVSNEFAEVLTKMIRYDFRERYQSAQEALAAVNSLLNQTGSTTLPNPPEKLSQPQLKRTYFSYRINHSIWLIVLLLVTVSTVIGLFPLGYLKISKSIIVLLKQIKIDILVGISTGVSTFGLLLSVRAVLKRRNQGKTHSIISHRKIRYSKIYSKSQIRKATPYTYRNLLERYDKSLEEVKALYRNMLDMQETHISSLKEILATNNSHITKLIDNSNSIKDSTSAREYNIRGKINHINFPEQEAKVSVEHSDQSRNINVGGDFTLSQSGSTLNLGDISGAVTNAINQLPDDTQSQQLSFKDLLTQLQKAIEEDADLPSADKVDLLDQVKVLTEAKQTSKQEEKEGLVRRAKKIFDATLKGLPETAKIVEACSNLLPLILKTLGFPS